MKRFVLFCLFALISIPAFAQPYYSYREEVTEYYGPSLGYAPSRTIVEYRLRPRRLHRRHAPRANFFFFRY